MLCLGLQCGGHTCPGLMNEIRDAVMLCHSVCCNNVGNGGVDMDGQDNVNIRELILWDVACQRGRTELLQSL